MLSRRQFLGDALAGVTAFVAVGCSPSHKQPRAKQPPIGSDGSDGFDGFGGRVDAGPLEHVREAIASKNAPYYVPAARAYVSSYPPEHVGDALGVYPHDVLPLLKAGVVVLYQRCTHLGCRVPFCSTSEWFECPCHVAKYDRVGEFRQGPAPRGMDLMKASIEHGRLIIDTGTILPGLPVGTNTTRQAASGPFCVG